MAVAFSESSGRKYMWEANGDVLAVERIIEASRDPRLAGTSFRSSTSNVNPCFGRWEPRQECKRGASWTMDKVSELCSEQEVSDVQFRHVEYCSVAFLTHK